MQEQNIEDIINKLNVDLEDYHFYKFKKQGYNLSDDLVDRILKYIKNSESEHANLIHNLGCGYEHGELGLKKDELKTLKYYKKAMKFNNGASYNNMAYAYQHGRLGLEKDFDKALEYYKKAMKFNNGSSYNNMAYTYEHGRLGLEKDFDKALEYYKKAMKLGDNVAHYNMGVIYQTGSLGLEKDYDKALEYYKKAMELGTDLAYYNVAHAYKYGKLGLEKNNKKALEYYKKAMGLNFQKDYIHKKVKKIVKEISEEHLNNEYYHELKSFQINNKEYLIDELDDTSIDKYAKYTNFIEEFPYHPLCYVHLNLQNSGLEKIRRLYDKNLIYVIYKFLY